MALRDFLKKQFIDVIHWTEPEVGILIVAISHAGHGDSERRQADRSRIATKRCS